MSILDVLGITGSGGLLDSLFGASSPAVPNAQQPLGLPATRFSGIPGAVPQQTGLLGNGLLGNAARGALYGLSAAGRPGASGFGAGLGAGAAQSIGMGMQRQGFQTQQALAQQELANRQMMNQFQGARLQAFNDALNGPGTSGGDQVLSGGGASGGAPGGVPQQGGAPDNSDAMQEYRAYTAMAQEEARLASLGVPGHSNERATMLQQMATQSLGYVGQKAGAEAQGKLPSEQDMAVFNKGLDAQYAGPIAAAQAAAKAPYDFHTVAPGGVGFFGGAGGAPGAVPSGSARVPTPTPAPTATPPARPVATPRPTAATPAPAVTAPVVNPDANAYGANSQPPPSGGVIRQNGMIINTQTPQQLNIGTDRSHSYRDNQGKALSDTMDKVQQAGHDASDSIRQIGELATQLRKLPTGTGTENLNDAAKVMERFGWDINKILPAGMQTDPVAYDAANKNIAELAMVIARANFPGGRITNADLTSAIRATPNLFNLPGANQILIDNLTSQMRLKVEQAKFFRQYENAPAGSFGGIKSADKGEIDNGVWDAWTQRIGELKNIPDNIKQSYQSFSDFGGGNSPAPSQSLGLPTGALQSATNQDGHTVFLFSKPGGGYYWAEKAQ